VRISADVLRRRGALIKEAAEVATAAGLKKM
jgi:hypothetical protein